MSTTWQETLLNGLSAPSGKPNKVAATYITKPIIHHQMPEHMIPTLDVVTDNNRNRGLTKNSKQKFSIHRSMSFLPQE
jgi:hypothetical protein